MEAGALGTETQAGDDLLIRVTGYFETVPDRERVRDELFEALRIYNLPSSSVHEMNVREVAQRDCLEEWKQNWQPVEIGRFIIAPPWTVLSEKHDGIVIRIEPGMAFGTGTHETTRLCLAAIQNTFPVTVFSTLAPARAFSPSQRPSFLRKRGSKRAIPMPKRCHRARKRGTNE